MSDSSFCHLPKWVNAKGVCEHPDHDQVKPKEGTLLGLLVDGLVDAGVFSDRDEAIEAVDSEISESLAATLSMVGYSVPAYSKTVRCFLIAQEVDD